MHVLAGGTSRAYRKAPAHGDPDYQVRLSRILDQERGFSAMRGVGQRKRPSMLKELMDASEELPAFLIESWAGFFTFASAELLAKRATAHQRPSYNRGPDHAAFKGEEGGKVGRREGGKG
jgi:hypothetical protein